jgi:hypothetical protein
MRFDIVNPVQRRIVAVEAHRRRSGRYPMLIHSLGTGETFEIQPLVDGFLDVTTGTKVCSGDGEIAIPGGTIELTLVDDIFFEGVVRANGERFSGRACGGSSVTLYDRLSDDYFQYAVVVEGDYT